VFLVHFQNDSRLTSFQCISTLSGVAGSKQNKTILTQKAQCWKGSFE
jgi:hypothetical protein